MTPGEVHRGRLARDSMCSESRGDTRMKAIAIASPALLLLATAALAQDDCLSGSSTLTDQRDLTTWRAAVETSCPCTSFTGAPGLDRRAYRSCAKGVLQTTLANGGLRTSCRATARVTYRGATCGTDRIACGRFRASSPKTPVTCRVVGAGKCASTASVERQICSASTLCADVVDWTAGSCQDVRAPGAFAPGYTIITFTKQSVVDPTQQRVLDTVIWYPAVPGSGPIDPAYAAVHDAPLDDSSGPYPLVMFSHGSCGYPAQSKFLWPLVATRGFIVAAPPHPGNTIFEFPQCDTPQAAVPSALERPRDIRFVLDQMLAADQDPASLFFGTIDETRIGMAGHSFGGYTTYVAVQADSRYKVAVPMAPAVPASMPVLTIPSLMMRSKLDSLVNNDAIQHEYDLASPPKFLVEIENAGHFAYSDGCFPSPDCNPPTTMTQDEAHAAVLRWVVPFLEKQLAGDERFASFLVPPAPPGIVLQSQP